MYVTGIDLATQVTGVAYAPLDWNYDWSKVTTVIIRAQPNHDFTDNLMVMTQQVTNHCRGTVFIEDCYVSKLNPATSLKLAMHRGALEFWYLGDLRPVQPSEHRLTSLGFGGGTRALIKAHTKKTFVAAGAQDNLSEDEYDALSVMNHGMMLRGGAFYTVPKVTG